MRSLVALALLISVQVKADEKTRAFLDEFEELNIRTDVSQGRSFRNVY